MTPAEPAGAVDALVAEFAPGVRAPAVRRRDVVLVVGPWLSGSSSVLTALQKRLPGQTFVESDELGSGDVPAAVVFVASAVAPLTESDCALLDTAAAHTDLVIGVLAKIDVHRRWRDVLDDDRRVLAAHRLRYAEVPWVGVAAAPELGDVQLDELVDVLRTRLTDEQLSRRNRLRAWEFRLEAEIRHYDSSADSVGRDARVAKLRESRVDVARQRRTAKTERAITLRSQIQQARVQLSYFARTRCTSVRSELQEDIAGLTRRTMDTFPAYVERRATDVVGEVNDGITEHLDDIANQHGLDGDWPTPTTTDTGESVGAPPLKSRRVETRLMMVLGAGFGLGVALTLSRIFADLAPGLTAVGAVICVLVGLAVTVWVVGMRGLLHDRAVLDRWVSDVTAALRATVDQLVATRVLTAETSFTVNLAEQDEARDVELAGQLRAIDAELREHAMAGARAGAVRDLQVPVVQRALDAVRADLGDEEKWRPNRPDGPTLDG